MNKNCIAIREYCAPKIVFGPGKLSGVSRNGHQNRCTQETSDKKHIQFQTQFHRAQNITQAQTEKKQYPFK